MEVSVRLLCGLLLISGIAHARRGHRGPQEKPPFQTPDELHTKFSVYRDGDTVDSLCPLSLLQKESLDVCRFNGSNPLVVIIHGWSLDGLMEDWVVALASALKVHLGEVNVVVCDWISLAQRFYPIAASNTRVVGQEVALFLDWLEASAHVPTRKVHLVGYSLGAHVAGFTGRLFTGARKLGRITGLDPAGPMFEGMPAADRLSPGDAMFVDAIHTFTKNHMVLSVGIRQPVAHRDFYPNGGTLQPGCHLSDMTRHISQHGFQGVSRAIKCAHERSVNLFIDSLLHKDQPITAFSCRDNAAFSQGLCLDCKRSRCSTLGYASTGARGGTSKRFYLRTRSHMPYRVFHYQLRLQLIDQAQQTSASASIVLRGQRGQSQELPLHLPAELRGNATLSSLVTVESDVGRLQSLLLRWAEPSVLADVWHRVRTIMPWGGRGGGGPVLSVGRLRVKAGETQDKMWFCSQGKSAAHLEPWKDHVFERCPPPRPPQHRSPVTSNTGQKSPVTSNTGQKSPEHIQHRPRGSSYQF